MTVLGPLGLSGDSLAACVQCGLCLPHCPTYRVTGDESRSPRGRISLMVAAELEGAPMDSEWLASMSTCVQCLGCETACPSGVPFEELISRTRAVMSSNRRPPLRIRLGLRLLGRPRLLRWGVSVLAVAQRLHLVPRTGLLPARLPLGGRHRRSAPGGDLLVFTGCVMDACQPEIHDAVEDVLVAGGRSVERTGAAVGCCGALHAHAGLHEEAVARAGMVIAALPGDRPILVDSAGCGAALKRYGGLLGTPAAAAFSARVFDVHEWLAANMEVLPEPSGRSAEPVVVQDPCHLRHAQGVHGAVRDVVGPYATLVELDDEGLCCGAGGAFQMMEPELATEVRGRKLAAIGRAFERSGARTVISANPGCAMYLEAAGLEVRHPMEVVAEALEDRRGR
ncbi:MAG: (Fe-S)-binding protein [Acidimicrobiales bacterium]|nr:(Fe-S)-binding protein [Acidimicrobiales bacterium]